MAQATCGVCSRRQNVQHRNFLGFYRVDCACGARTKAPLTDSYRAIYQVLLFFAVVSVLVAPSLFWLFFGGGAAIALYQDRKLRGSAVIAR